MDGLSYCVGRVAAKGEGMLGHHVADVGDKVPRTLFLADEASGVDDVSYKRAETWARRKLIIGNPYPCENFFKKGVSEGDLKSRDGKRYYRKIIRITGHDSPNVRLSKYNLSKGLEPVVDVPGVLPYDDYVKRLETWDPIQISVGIDAKFYEGAEVQLFPPQWLEHSLKLHELLIGRPRQAKAVGVDPAEGGDSTSWAAVDELGVIEILSKKTPDTQDIVDTTLAFMAKHSVKSDNVVFDSGGGGRQIVDQLRRLGHYGVRTVSFGEPISEPPTRATKAIGERVYEKENRVTYKNRRAQMYGELRERMNPSGDNPYGGFAIPKGGPFLPQYDHGVYDELRHQLRPIPLMYDSEGKLRLPPKNKTNPDSKEVTLVQLIGHSPDEADALVLALHGLIHAKKKSRAGAGRR